MKGRGGAGPHPAAESRPDVAAGLRGGGGAGGGCGHPLRPAPLGWAQLRPAGGPHASAQPAQPVRGHRDTVRPQHRHGGPKPVSVAPNPSWCPPPPPTCITGSESEVNFLWFLPHFGACPTQ